MPNESAISISKRRREREHEEMNARIKDIAREMFVRDGYEAVTLQKIADAMEYTRPALYRYFKDKDALLAQIVLDDMEELHALLMDCAAIVDPLERLIEMARRSGAWAVEHPNHYLLFHSPAWTTQEDAVRAQQGIPKEREPLRLLYNTINELIKHKKVRSEYADAALLARTVWAGIHGTIMLELTMSEYDRGLIHDRLRPFPERLDMMLKGLMKGFLKE